MFLNFRRLSLGWLGIGSLQNPTAATACSQAAVRLATVPSLPIEVGEPQSEDACSTSGNDDGGCSNSGSCGWRSGTASFAPRLFGTDTTAHISHIAIFPAEAVSKAFARISNGFRGGWSTVALQLGLGNRLDSGFGGGLCNGDGVLLLARRLPTEPEPFEDEYDDDEYEDGEFVDLDDEDLLGDLGEVQDWEEDELPGRWLGDEGDEGELEEGFDEGEEEAPPPPPPAASSRRGGWR
ncbi:hypothetical protein Vretimale_13448 [Volvox reticuliferus]|uniref:Uncharacterized protein n=1 Tax=Volvox reticuliferus TaxID=1737510 RepID=A0A8J4LTJ1_9CHLO|nr:hypothetical protein Vretifemale_283 [Volvox reticuliferus]GIM09607.1 hypothetical protein Vretimale_13448 [Volvox reticuliferus]